MTSTQEPGEGHGVVPEFARLARTQTKEFILDDDARRLLDDLLVRGSREVRRLEGPDRDEAIEIALTRLNRAMDAAATEFRAAGLIEVDADSLLVIMQGLCPVPPFCSGGPNDGGLATDSGDDAPAMAEPALAEY